MSLRPDGTLVFSIGASRSGKTQFVSTQTKSEKRLLVWDVEGEFASKHGLEVVTGKIALLKRLDRATGNAAIAYHPETLREFNFFCRCAFNWSRQKPATIIVEELAASTNAVKAGGHWGVLVSRGFKHGTKIYGVVQRGQETDKSILGNATIVNICRPNTQHDAKYIADTFGLSLSDIPDADLEMLQRHKNRTLSKMKIHFKNNKPFLKSIQKFSAHF